jgi:hypothetical protein
VGQDKFYNPTTGDTTTLQSIVRDFMSDEEAVEASTTESTEEAEEKAEHVKTKFIIIDMEDAAE